MAHFYDPQQGFRCSCSTCYERAWFEALERNVPDSIPDRYDAPNIWRTWSSAPKVDRKRGSVDFGDWEAPLRVGTRPNDPQPEFPESKATPPWCDRCGMIHALDWPECKYLEYGPVWRTPAWQEWHMGWAGLIFVGQCTDHARNKRCPTCDKDAHWLSLTEKPFQAWLPARPTPIQVWPCPWDAMTPAQKKLAGLMAERRFTQERGGGPRYTLTPEQMQQAQAMLTQLQAYREAPVPQAKPEYKTTQEERLAYLLASAPGEWFTLGEMTRMAYALKDGEVPTEAQKRGTSRILKRMAEKGTKWAPIQVERLEEPGQSVLFRNPEPS